MRPLLNRLPCGQSDPLWICSNADSCCIGNSLRSKRFCGFSEQRKTEERDFDNFAAQEMVDSVSSRCSGMSPRSPPESLSGGEHGLIPKQRLDTEPKEMGKSEKWSEGRGGGGGRNYSIFSLPFLPWQNYQNLVFRSFFCFENPQKCLLRRLHWKLLEVAE